MERLLLFLSKSIFMIKLLVSASLILTLFSTVRAQNKISHQAWNSLLAKHVSPYGLVDYEGFKKDEAKLNGYLELLRKNVPNGYWNVNSQKAYWINAYNAFTVKLILEHYPLESIMEIKVDEKDAWHIPFINLDNKLYTLDYIENVMLRGQFNDSRIHFVINCSAVSCPPLKNKAYFPDNLDIELRLSARRFINDKRHNILSENHLQVSQIFQWYEKDFLVEEPTIQQYININTPHIEVSKDASLNYLEYNWKLNKQ